MNLWTYAVAAGLVTAALVDAAKIFLPRGLPGPASKVAAGFVVSVCLSVGYLYWAHWSACFLVWGLAWGIARLVHSLTSTLQTSKDRQRSELRRAFPPRQRR